MYNILLVDDEIFSIEAMQSAIEWSSLKISNVYTAYNMDQAIDIYKAHMIHVMICDIEMPNGSGIELAGWVTRFSPETINIFLTCHENFTYAKEAISLNAFEYLLKPMPYAELASYIERAVKKFEEDERQRDNEQIITKNKDILDEHFWLEILNNEMEKERIIQQAFIKRVSLKYSNEYLPVLISIKRLNHLLQTWNRNELDYTIKNIISEIMYLPELKTTIIAVYEGVWCILIIGKISSRKEQIDINEKCNYLRQIVYRYLGENLCFYIGKTVQLEMLRNEYNNLQVLDQNNVTEQETLKSENASPEGVSIIQNYDLELNFKELSLLFENENGTEVQIRIFKYINTLVNRNKVSRQLLFQLYHNINQIVYSTLFQNNILAHELLSSMNMIDAVNSPYNSVADIKKYIGDIVELSSRKIKEIKKPQSIIEGIKQHIQDNLDGDLSRDQIGKIFYINSVYLSRLFKKETGVSLQDYIQNLRIETAKQLLEYTNDSVNLICNKIGYTYSSHFANVFKKEVGMTPKQYRNRLSQIK